MLSFVLQTKLLLSNIFIETILTSVANPRRLSQTEAVCRSVNVFSKSRGNVVMSIEAEGDKIVRIRKTGLNLKRFNMSMVHSPFGYTPPIKLLSPYDNKYII